MMITVLHGFSDTCAAITIVPRVHASTTDHGITDVVVVTVVVAVVTSRVLYRPTTGLLLKHVRAGAGHKANALHWNSRRCRHRR